MGRTGTAGPALAAPHGAQVYTVGQMTVATLIGTPLAGCLLLALNESALGRPRRRDAMIVAGVVITIVSMAIAFTLPETIPNTLLPALYTIAMFFVARWLQGRAIAAHRHHSHWRMLGLAIACHVVVAATCISIVSLATHGQMRAAPIGT